MLVISVAFMWSANGCGLCRDTTLTTQPVGLFWKCRRGSYRTAFFMERKNHITISFRVISLTPLQSYYCPWRVWINTIPEYSTTGLYHHIQSTAKPCTYESVSMVDYLHDLKYHIQGCMVNVITIGVHQWYSCVTNKGLYPSCACII